MLCLCSHITIGTFEARYVHEVVIKSAWENLTQTAVIKLPRALQAPDGRLLEDVIKYGDAVTIELGYDTELKLRFKGYVVRKSAATALMEIECEDEMFKLKTGSYSKSWKNAEVGDILAYIKQKVNGTWAYETLGQSMTIGPFEVENLSACKILDKLRDNGIYAFFRFGANGEPKLIVGKPYDPEKANRRLVYFRYGHNVISWKDLEFKSADEVKLRVRVTVHMPDGKQKKFEVGDPDGEARSLDLYNLADAPAKEQAQRLYELMKYSGYRGSFPAFGEPIVAHGDVAVMEDRRYPNRSGSYFIDAVETTFKIAQFRQKITVGPLAA